MSSAFLWGTLYAGSTAPRGLSVADVFEAAVRRIEARGARVPDPVAVRVSHWASDPFARGSYSYPGVGAFGNDRTLLARPVEDTLFFAGEATHRDDPGSVHGAWWSGLRAARQILGEA